MRESLAVDAHGPTDARTYDDGSSALEFEVSRRTITRALHALRVAGFPVHTERGPGGGVYLHEDFRTQLTDLARDELEALFTLGVPPPLADLGMGAQAKGAMLKLAAGLPAARSAVERESRRTGSLRRGQQGMSYGNGGTE